MRNLIDVEKALNLKNAVFIDVRSPKEYNEATIPKSVNIPLLDDEERAIIGKVYRKKSIDEAKSLGLRYASPKLENIYNEIQNLKKLYENIVIFCWRGGMRSRSVCSILNMMNIGNVYQLKGGYKAYRRYVFNFLKNEVSNYKFITLHGLTGVGKTSILYELSKNNIPTINLEDMAKNSGSVFGNLFFEGDSPSQKEFESLIFNKLYFNNKGYVILESESKRIGNVNIPDSVMQSMNGGYHILIQTNLNNRIQNIYKDYTKIKTNLDERIISAISHLKKRLGNENVQMLIEKVQCKEYEFVIEFLIKEYYDPLYKYSINKIKKYDLTINYDDIQEAVTEVKAFIKDNKLYESRKGKTDEF
ncbi:MAG: tRNA 2-selenouridine synthase [Candidatus Petromonas sp.]|jgi:tRNA 2-selenouridine synthase|nr:tRNA 2-selenouridine synthase [Candidatus Petromonas sp.]